MAANVVKSVNRQDTSVDVMERTIMEIDVKDRVHVPNHIATALIHMNALKFE